MTPYTSQVSASPGGWLQALMWHSHHQHSEDTGVIQHKIIIIKIKHKAGRKAANWTATNGQE
jgi:hypothetical protein